jgi:hypothetical protein
MGLPGFSIVFDYRFAPANAFDSAARQRLERAAQIWSSFIADDFADIPLGTPIRISNPQTDEFETITLDYDIDDLVIFVGAKPISYAAAYEQNASINGSSALDD